MASWDRYGDGGNITRLPLKLHPVDEIDPEALPPREWLYGTILQRGHVTVLVAPGGTGKTQASMAMGLDVASGRGLLGYHIFCRVPVWLLSLEDPALEMQRRIAAFRLLHRVPWAELRGYFYTHVGRERPVVMAQVSPDDGATIIFPDLAEITALARAGMIGVIIVDPFIRSHELLENSTEHMNKAVTAWNEVAEQTGCAILLVHHVRKGTIEGIDSARGAKALTDAARVGLLLSSMSSEDAQAVGIKDDDRHRFLRLDSAKVNMAAAGEAVWFEMCEQHLGNSTPTYPDGDTVSALRRWRKPTPWDCLDLPMLRQIFDELANGPGEGEQYTLSRSGPSAARWAGHAITRIAGTSEAQSTAVLLAWSDNGVVTPCPYRSPSQRRERQGIALNTAKIDEILRSMIREDRP